MQIYEAVVEEDEVSSKEVVQMPTSVFSLKRPDAGDVVEET